MPSTKTRVSLDQPGSAEPVAAKQIGPVSCSDVADQVTRNESDFCITGKKRSISLA